MRRMNINISNSVRFGVRVRVRVRVMVMVRVVVRVRVMVRVMVRVRVRVWYLLLYHDFDGAHPQSTTIFCRRPSEAK